MSATDRQTPAARDLATQLREATFARLVATPDGDSVAAAGLLARTLDGRGVPYQSSVTPPYEPAIRGTDADLAVGIGRSVGDGPSIGIDDVATRTAYTACRELGAEPDTESLALALAGAVAGAGHPGERLAGDAQGVFERRPGVAVPTAELADGLAHSLLVHAPFSVDAERATALVAGVDPESEDGRQTVASRVTLAVAADSEGTPRGAERIERLLRPLSGGPFETIGGYADVLQAVSREQPGLGIVLALDRLDRARALECWRRHATATHSALREAGTSRYDGLSVYRCAGEAPVATVAELALAYRSPEPAVLAASETRAAIAVDRTAESAVHAGETLDHAAAVCDGRAGGTRTRGQAQFDCEPTEFVAAVTEVV